jgi:anti-anti-sigma factor
LHWENQFGYICADAEHGRESKRIVLDLTNAKHLDSSGVGALFKLWVNAKKAECEFKVSNLNERIRGLLTTTNLSKILGG